MTSQLNFTLYKYTRRVRKRRKRGSSGLNLYKVLSRMIMCFGLHERRSETTLAVDVHMLAVRQYTTLYRIAQLVNTLAVCSARIDAKSMSCYFFTERERERLTAKRKLLPALINHQQLLFNLKKKKNSSRL